MPIADTLLRLAEDPPFYIPKWSPEILEELRTVLKRRFGHEEHQADRRIKAMMKAFPEAMVTGYQPLTPSMGNDPKDRHVLAAAVRAGADAIVSDNQKHFPKASLEPYGIECVSADDFLKHQYSLHPDELVSILVEQAATIGWTLPQLLARHAPSLAAIIPSRSG